MLKNRKSHRKPRHNHTYALGAFRRVFVLRSFAFFFPLYKVECPWGRQAHVFLMRLSLRGFLRDPHLPQMLLRCHVEAYPPLSPLLSPPFSLPPLLTLPTFHLRKHLAKVAAWKKSAESTCQKAEPHFKHPPKMFLLFFVHFPRCKYNPLALYLLCCWVRFSRDRLCTDVFIFYFVACSWDRGRRCPVLTEDSRGHYREA